MKKVLIVDDDHFMRNCMEAVLRKAGFRTSEAADGISAMGELLRDRPDAVLLDHNMPFMTGIELLTEFKKIAPEVPVVMLSGSADRTLYETAKSEGAFDFLSKPADNEDIVAAVHRAMASAEGI